MCYAQILIWQKRCSQKDPDRRIGQGEWRQKGTKTRWKSSDDGVLVGVLTEQASAGHQSDNGWKALVWTAASLALQGSELKSGGAPKSDDACLSRWGKVRAVAGLFLHQALITTCKAQENLPVHQETS